ncbi:MAG: zf-HC2 domain-containing protein [Pirellulales bacterium]
MNSFHESWLTAYLDDELTPDERREVEAKLQSDVGLRSMLDDLRSVRSVVAKLSNASMESDLTSQIMKDLASLSIEPIEVDSNEEQVSPSEAVVRLGSPEWKRSSHPWRYMGTAIAACFAMVMFGLYVWVPQNLFRSHVAMGRPEPKSSAPDVRSPSRADLNVSDKAPADVPTNELIDRATDSIDRSVARDSEGMKEKLESRVGNTDLVRTESLGGVAGNSPVPGSMMGGGMGGAGLGASPAAQGSPPSFGTRGSGGMGGESGGRRFDPAKAAAPAPKEIVIEEMDQARPAVAPAESTRSIAKGKQNDMPETPPASSGFLPAPAMVADASAGALKKKTEAAMGQVEEPLFVYAAPVSEVGNRNEVRDSMAVASEVQPQQLASNYLSIRVDRSIPPEDLNKWGFQEERLVVPSSEDFLQNRSANPSQSNERAKLDETYRSQVPTPSPNDHLMRSQSGKLWSTPQNSLQYNNQYNFQNAAQNAAQNTVQSQNAFRGNNRNRLTLVMPEEKVPELERQIRNSGRAVQATTQNYFFGNAAPQDRPPAVENPLQLEENRWIVVEIDNP